MAAVTALSESALHPELRDRALLQSLSPQGWAFFTRDPRETWHQAYTVDARAGLHPANNADHRGAPWNGARRHLRNRGIVLAEILRGVPTAAWQACEGDLARCLERSAGDRVDVELRAHDHTGLCGELVVQQVKTVPWAWRNSFSGEHARSKYARVDVSCVQL